MAINKVQYGNTTLIDLTDTTAVASDVMQGKYFYGRDGVRVEGTNTGGSGDGYVWQDAQGYVHLSDEEGTLPTVDSLTVSASGTYTAPQGHVYNPVIVPSGTEGTPSATKGAVSNHSVSVTPSVTNTAGFISGGTKTGTAVTVSASELVSGSQTITTNNTYDVTNLASVVVNVGGSGLVYEEGTWTPSEDIAKPTISFANSHNSAPTSIIMSDTTGTDDNQTNTNYGFTYNSFHSYTGEGVPCNTNDNARYGLTSYVYRGSGTNPSQVVLGLTQLNKTSSSYAQDHWTTSSGFSPNSDSDARYWRANRTYKWIAVWASTT